MATSNRNNVSLRGEQTRPLTHTEMDGNFIEVRKAIDDIHNIEQSVDDLVGGTSDVIDAIQEDMDDITQATNINSIKIESIETKNSDQDNRLASLEGDLSSLSDDLDSMGNRVQDNANDIIENNNAVQFLSGVVQDHQAAITAANQRIDDLPGQIVPPPTNLGAIASAGHVTITSSTGGNATFPLATTNNAGAFAPAEKAKLNSMGNMGQRNVTVSTGNPTGG